VSKLLHLLFVQSKRSRSAGATLKARPYSAVSMGPKKESGRRKNPAAAVVIA